MQYIRPILSIDPAAPEGALFLGGGWAWFSHVEILYRGKEAEIIPASDLPLEKLELLLQPRANIAGISFDAPRIMGILNVTPDSFSDGGSFYASPMALQQAGHLARCGADLLDIGGESTRPGANFVEEDEEKARILPVIQALRGRALISVDTRKAGVARAALNAGASIINDVSAFEFDPAMAEVAGAAAGVCLMHSQGTPDQMQKDPRYESVLLDVYDALDLAIRRAAQAGIPRERIIIDPGIGFGKTLKHNLDLLKRISLFHSLGCVLLLGVSRKRFIGEISGVAEAENRVAGSLAVAMAAIANGVHMVRVHDVAQTAEAKALSMALWD